MSYSHKKVEKLVNDTQNYVNDSRFLNTGLTKFPTLPDTPIVISEPLNAFIQEIKAQHRNVKFGVDSDCATNHSTTGRMKMEAWVYFAGDEYAVAKIGHGDYSLNREGERKFMVFARDITNDKFKPFRDQHNMAFAEKLPKAVKNFNANLRRYTVTDIAVMSLGDMRSNLASANYRANSNLRHKWHEVQSHNDLRTELLHLLESGHAFLSNTLRAALEQFIETREEDKHRNVLRNAYFVRVTTNDRDEQLFSLLFYPDIENNVRPNPTLRMFTYEQLCEAEPDVAARLASLSILERDKFVEGVGMRVDDTNFWVSV